METKCAMIKLKPDSLEAVKQWAKTMNDRKDEALETLKNEGVKVESVFFTKIAGDDYLIYYMRAEDMKKAQNIGRNSLMDIDIIHKEFQKNHWENISPVKLLLDLELE